MKNLLFLCAILIYNNAIAQINYSNDLIKDLLINESGDDYSIHYSDYFEELDSGFVFYNNHRDESWEEAHRLIKTDYNLIPIDTLELSDLDLVGINNPNYFGLIYQEEEAIIWLWVHGMFTENYCRISMDTNLQVTAYDYFNYRSDVGPFLSPQTFMGNYFVWGSEPLDGSTGTIISVFDEELQLIAERNPPNYPLSVGNLLTTESGQVFLQGSKSLSAYEGVNLDSIDYVLIPNIHDYEFKVEPDMQTLSIGSEQFICGSAFDLALDTVYNLPLVERYFDRVYRLNETNDTLVPIFDMQSHPTGFWPHERTKSLDGLTTDRIYFGSNYVIAPGPQDVTTTFVVHAINAEGELHWSKYFGDNISDNVLTNVIALKDGGVLLIISKAELYTGSLIVNTHYVKLNEFGEVEGTTNTVGNYISDVSFRLFPNPVIDLVTIDIATDMPFSGTLYLTTAKGQIIFQETYNNLIEPISIDCADYPAGVYYVNVENQIGQRFVRSIVVK